MSGVTLYGITLYGIKNCDTVRKARKWLEQNNIEYSFHDFRSDGLEHPVVSAWARAVGWENLLNRRSTTWKQLGQELRENMDATSAIETMTTHPTLIKRPVLEHKKGAQKNDIQVGFTPEHYQQLFG